MTTQLIDQSNRPPLDHSLCKRARLSRDVRFDGQFFTAVKTTRVYCRPICPASPPLEKNVDYYYSSVEAAQAGFRPCLRCRPDSAPQSYAWLGTKTTFQRALRLIQQGALQESSLEGLATRLGVTSRYLRKLFNTNLGISPKKYAIYQQCLFAKQLLHETSLPITQVAFGSGFNSVRRFNEAMQQQLKLTPSDIRNSDKPVQNKIELKLYYRPPFAWKHSFNFLHNRVIPQLEWTNNETYCRTIRYANSVGWFSVTNNSEQNCLLLTLNLDNYRHLNAITQRIRLLFDVDAPIAQIDDQLSSYLPEDFNYLPGLRVPGVWSSFETGIRAILGQQVSVTQAKNLVASLVDNLGEDIIINDQTTRKLFPAPSKVSDHCLDFFAMPQARKDTVRRFADSFATEQIPDDIDDWLSLKGIGPWTVNYVKIRSSKDPDIWLEGDAGIKNALKRFNVELDIEQARPWRSYLTLQCWNQLK